LLQRSPGAAVVSTFRYVELDFQCLSITAVGQVWSVPRSGRLSLPHSLCWVTLRELLQETLDEEQATDEALTEIAKSTINQQAEAAE
jgi:hypothetical protein